MKLDIKTTVLIIFITFFAPVFINCLMFIPSFGLAAVNTEGWLGFFSNYSGGIIGGFVAFIIASRQIKAQNDENNKNEIENSRSYIILEEFIAPVDLRNVNTNFNSKILNNEFYEAIKEDWIDERKQIPFYKLHHNGLPEIILDCEIEISLKGEYSNSAQTSDYLIQSHLGVFEKNIEIFIPITNKDFTFVQPKKVDISYRTIKGERIRYIYDVENMNEKHILISQDGKSNDEILHNIKLKGVEWIYPAKLNKTNFLSKYPFED